MAGHGWQAGVADPDTPGGRAELTFDRATLLVVDDADLHGRLLEALVRILGYWPPDAPPVRLLLLARHTAGWWAILNQRTDHLTDDLAEESLALMEGELPDNERATHHLRALTAFTRHLPNPADAAERTAPDLTDAAFANPLLVHMTALLAAASAEVPTTGSAVARAGPGRGPRPGAGPVGRDLSTRRAHRRRDHPPAGHRRRHPARPTRRGRHHRAAHPHRRLQRRRRRGPGSGGDLAA